MEAGYVVNALFRPDAEGPAGPVSEIQNRAGKFRIRSPAKSGALGKTAATAGPAGYDPLIVLDAASHTAAVLWK